MLEVLSQGTIRWHFKWEQNVNLCAFCLMTIALQSPFRSKDKRQVLEESQVQALQTFCIARNQGMDSPEAAHNAALTETADFSIADFMEPAESRPLHNDLPETFRCGITTIWLVRSDLDLEVSTPGVGWSWGSTLTPNYGGLGGGGGLELSNSATS